MTKRGVPRNDKREGVIASRRREPFASCHSDPEPFDCCHSEGAERLKNLAQGKLREGGRRGNPKAKKIFTKIKKKFKFL